MHQRATVTMSMRELDRLKVLQAVVGGELSVIRAAERLAMCTRQVRRLAQRYRPEGPVGLISRARDRPGNRRLNADVETEVTRILRERYADFGPTLATEKLAERHQIVLTKETVREIQIAVSLWFANADARFRDPALRPGSLRGAAMLPPPRCIRPGSTLVESARRLAAKPQGETRSVRESLARLPPRSIPWQHSREDRVRTLKNLPQCPRLPLHSA
jgi:transposase